ncbi:MAG: hypothetical protein ACJAT4_000833, partial [Granulosicoccus sp.]
ESIFFAFLGENEGVNLKKCRFTETIPLNFTLKE